LDRVPLSLSAVAEGALAIVRSGAAAKSLTLCSELAPDLPAWIEGDPTRLRQILLNFLLNAIKFTDRGMVVLRVMRTPGAATGQLRFEVTDTGIGAEQHLLFRTFSQVVQSADRQFGGTGLGPAISRHLVEAMGGAIGVDSRSGAGSTFWFTIPCVETRPQATTETKEREVNAGRRARILVAEDRDRIREYIGAVLTDAGHEVVLVQNGTEAIAAVKARDFDVVLMDVQMPEMDGIAATRHIREMGDRGRGIPIIALTAYAMQRDVARCRAAGVNEHLAKPDRSQRVAASRREMVGKPLGHAPARHMYRYSLLPVLARMRRSALHMRRPVNAPKRTWWLQLASSESCQNRNLQGLVRRVISRGSADLEPGAAEPMLTVKYFGRHTGVTIRDGVRRLEASALAPPSVTAPSSSARLTGRRFRSSRRRSAACCR
jgi:CheY-like chemotaxis protein